jgi:beta-glucosidase
MRTATIDIGGLLDSLSLEEQVSLLSGADFWTTVPVERLGIPAIKVTDGPNGARGGGGLVGGLSAAAFPVAISLGSSFDPDLVRRVAGAIAAEALTKGAHVLLAPTINIHRSAVNGRNFECHSEDPHLAAEMAAAYVEGVQEKGVAATIKHFAGNESEYQRMTISSEIGERALREIYLPPFEAAVKRAGALAVMSAYNKVNGTFASENRRLLTGILRDQWGFDGLVMSDWFGSHSTAETVEAGLDLEMPGPARDRGGKLVEAVKNGFVGADKVRAAARNVLRLVARVGAFDNPGIAPERSVDRPDHRALIREAAADGMVLLKNDVVLPLSTDAGLTLAVVGPNARTARIMGGGSAQLNPHHVSAPVEALTAVFGQNSVRVEEGCANNRLRSLLCGPIEVSYFAGRDLSGAAHGVTVNEAEFFWVAPPAPGVDPLKMSARLKTEFVAEFSGEHEFGLVSAGRSRLFLDGEPVVDAWTGWEPGENYFGAGCDEAIETVRLEVGRRYEVTVEFAAVEQAMAFSALRVGVSRVLGEGAVARAVELARTSDVALVYAGRSGEWDSEGLDLPSIALPGRQDELIERVAAVNPRTVVVLQTGGPVAMPWLGKVAAVLQAWYPGQECGDAIADVLTGLRDPGGRLPQTFPKRIEDTPVAVGDPRVYPGVDGAVEYREGIFVGYRHYDAKGIAPLFPFGHGLSYTSFAWSNLRLDRERIAPAGEIALSLEVRNTGGRPGVEVVQVYVRDVSASVERPQKELKAFAKVLLQPGETRTIRLSLGMRALAFFDVERKAWVAEAGAFEVLAGASAGDIRLSAGFELESEWIEAVGSPPSLKSNRFRRR